MIARLCFAAAALAAVAPGGAQADLVSYYDFNNGTASTNSAANTAALFTRTQGNGTISTNFDPTTINAFTGTTTNAVAGDTAGVALALQDGTANVNAGKYLQITSSTVGETNIALSFAIQATATGFQSDQIQYTTDGINYTNFGAAFTPISSSPGFGIAPAGLVNFDFTSVTALNNNINAGFRIVFNLGKNPTTGAPNAGSAAGNNRIDNIQINGSPTAAGVVPEPASLLMLGLGLAGAAGLAARRKRAA